MYIKAFTEDLKCRGFQYEIGKTYTTDKEIKLCGYGFHFCDDLCDTLIFYNAYSRYCEIIPDKHTLKDENKYVTNSITIVRELTLAELIDLDTTGEWCYNYASIIGVSMSDKKLLQDAVIKKDKTGKWCYNYACWVNGADQELLEAIAIEKDKIYNKKIKGEMNE